ncbi:glycosyl transferase family protein [Pseudomonas fluorescens]|uniref:Glycosyl transferase family protein n=1 Tax=Pseudomonas fluorescens TaxID=294 RepID=A0A379IBB1_PSEFL|nr:glycosyltransferase [Pseudomonas fluorescens]AIG05689.1 glycosyl transferase [Pseudomonas fluorescens]SUD30165.1 glycosyl transferase family protein [Pseudomonas fluorescens]
MQPRILVLLAAYNGMRWMAEQVDSILGQVGVSVSILISVDSSSDGTEEWVDQLCQRDSRVKCLAHGEKFGGAARNFFRLINEAPTENFDYFSFADQDDIWLPDKLASATQHMSDTGADGYSGNVTAFWPDGRESIIVKSQAQVAYDHLFEAAGPGCTYVFCRRLFAELQQHINSRFAQVQGVTLHDWYCYAYSRSHGFKWVIDARPYMRYRQHGGNQVGVNSGSKAFKKRLSQVFDGWWLNQAALIAGMVGMADEPFVRRWIGLGRLDLLRLAASATRCRRRPRDKLVFAGLCLVLAVLRQKK